VGREAEEEMGQETVGKMSGEGKELERKKNFNFPASFQN
jgi:hypothetical protein